MVSAVSLMPKYAALAPTTLYVIVENCGSTPGRLGSNRYPIHNDVISTVYDTLDMYGGLFTYKI